MKLQLLPPVATKRQSRILTARLRGANSLLKFLSVRRRWGLTVNLWFELDSRREIRRIEFNVQTGVRLHDPVREFPVSAKIEFATEPLSMLRAVAAMGHDSEIHETFEEVLKDFYQNITMDQLVDPVNRNVWLAQLRAKVELAGRKFGRKARLVEMVEHPPALPSNTDEKVSVALTERLIYGEPDPIIINMSATLKLTSSSTLLRAMEPRPGRSFNQEFDFIARSIFGPLADGWTANDYKIANRQVLEDDLRHHLTAPAEGFGYQIVATTITTSLDPENAEISPTASLLRGNFRTTAPDVTVDIEVTVKLTFDPGQRHRKTISDVLEPYAEEIRGLLTQALGKLPPSEIYLHWLVPWSHSDALHKVLKGQIEEKFRKVAYAVEVDIRLHGHVELLQLRDQVLRVPLRMERIPLNRENVPGEITVDLHAPVIGIAEEAWGEMSKLLAIGQTWDPVRDVEGDLVRIIQKPFRTVMESTVQQRVSKKSIIADLADIISREVLTNYNINIRPDIVAYSSREVLAFFEHQAKAKEQRVRDFLELNDKIEGLIHQKKLERLQLIGDGHANMARTKEIQGTIESLESELLKGQSQTNAYQREHQDALYFVQLLTVPADEPSTPPSPDQRSAKGLSPNNAKDDPSDASSPDEKRPADGK